MNLFVLPNHVSVLVLIYFLRAGFQELSFGTDEAVMAVRSELELQFHSAFHDIW